MNFQIRSSVLMLQLT